MTEPTTDAGKRIDAAFAAAAARGDTSASWEDARSWVIAIEREACNAMVERIRAALDAAVDASTLHWLAMDDVYAVLDAEKLDTPRPTGV